MLRNGNASSKLDGFREALLRRGAGPVTATRIVEECRAAESDRQTHPAYERRTRRDLYQRARELGISGRSTMNKQQLIEALRDR